MEQYTLKHFLKYDPDTGHFTNRVTRSNKAVAGNIAGSINSSGYINIMLCGKFFKAHRLAFLYMNGELPANQVDHINHVKDDNRWYNLREVTHQENQRNRSMSKNNTSGCTGVYWNKTDKKWHASVWINGKNKHLGCFAIFNDAVAVRKKAECNLGYHINHNS